MDRETRNDGGDLRVMVSELVKGTIVPAPVTVSKGDTVLLLGTLLASWNVSSVIVTDNGKMVGAVYGYQLVARLMTRTNKQILKLLLQPISQVMGVMSLSQAPSVRPKDTVSSLLTKIAKRRFGDVILTGNNGRPIGILSLSNIVPCLALRKKKVPVKVKDVSSRLKLASQEHSLSDALRYMMRNRIRRAVVKRDAEFFGLTEREIMKTFFSFEGLQSLSEDARSFPHSSLGQIIDGQAKRLSKVKGDVNIHDAWGHLDGDPRGCLIVDESLIATPWDLVMKPFLEGKLIA